MKTLLEIINGIVFIVVMAILAILAFFIFTPVNALTAFIQHYCKLDNAQAQRLCDFLLIVEISALVFFVLIKLLGVR